MIFPYPPGAKPLGSQLQMAALLVKARLVLDDYG
jgi:hypothetical protein